ncbi:hypothetical protein L226DRAFT_537322 [Lentinus tigrinus ALCF2SS1-7]|uniref:uncharacterized protein n=1 Tax=Lentinus tigrinus ALCF2SS1-7 TaxID=1328758 RepID=UPI0011661ACA|nr:hypothetical protein L226DRAFT_537322 [Lentinus tigrinus ALCF2SS1-7]
MVAEHEDVPQTLSIAGSTRAPRRELHYLVDTEGVELPSDSVLTIQQPQSLSRPKNAVIQRFVLTLDMDALASDSAR